MPPSVDSPVQTQLALPVPDVVFGSGRNGPGGLCTRPVGRRRIFVQTDTGSVLGIELDRADNVQTVKKKMQIMLNVPSEQTALVFGDTVFKSDLSELRNHSPLLLTRELQRSLSTPCIFPSSDVQVPADVGQPFEVVGGLVCCSKMKRIIKEIVQAIECGVEPMAVSGGLGGAYYFRNVRGESVAVVKPTDEEPFAPNNPKGFVGKSLGQPGLKRSVRVGETGIREVAAYLLDHEHFAKVPPTVLVKVSHHAFHINDATSVHKGPEKACSPVAKIASCQQFVHHDFDASDHGTSCFSVSAVHRIGILDIRIFNTDRHAGNILVRNAKPLDSRGAWGCSNVHVNEVLELIPIDHGLCLPEALEDPYFEWLHWPQSSLPFSEVELDYIQRLDEFKDADMLRHELPMLREACFRMLILSTTVLKRTAAAGLCLAEIGEMMSRDAIEEASELELLCMQARLQVDIELSAEKLCDEDDAFSEYSLFEFEMDQEDDRKFNATTDVDQLFSRTDCLNLSSFRYSFVPMSAVSSTNLAFSNSSVPFSNVTTLGGNHWSSSLSHTASKTPQPSRMPLEGLCEASSLKEEGELNLPACKMSAARPSFWNSGSAAPKAIPFGGKLEINPTVGPELCPLVEEEEVKCFAETNLKARIASCKVDFASLRSMPHRSISFGNRKQKYTDYPECRAPASETVRKVNVNGVLPPLSLGDMNEEEWTCFMDHFEELLQEALAIKCKQNVSHRQRLGISCQF